MMDYRNNGTNDFLIIGAIYICLVWSPARPIGFGVVLQPPIGAERLGGHDSAAGALCSRDGLYHLCGGPTAGGDRRCGGDEPGRADGDDDADGHHGQTTRWGGTMKDAAEGHSDEDLAMLRDSVTSWSEPSLSMSVNTAAITGRSPLHSPTWAMLMVP